MTVNYFARKLEHIASIVAGLLICLSGFVILSQVFLINPSHEKKVFFIGLMTVTFIGFLVIGIGQVIRSFQMLWIHTNGIGLNIPLLSVSGTELAYQSLYRVTWRKVKHIQNVKYYDGRLARYLIILDVDDAERYLLTDPNTSDVKRYKKVQKLAQKLFSKKFEDILIIDTRDFKAQDRTDLFIELRNRLNSSA